MIEFEQLIHLVAFYEHQTLSEAAKHLHISQPVLTRSMQKLEEVMGVTLFQRTKNRISFNETGFMAVEYAKRIINDTTDMKKQLQLFDRTLHTFSIGSCAPAPNIHLSQRASQTYPEKTIQSEIKDMDVLIQGLKDKRIQLSLCLMISMMKILKVFLLWRNNYTFLYLLIILTLTNLPSL